MPFIHIRSLPQPPEVDTSKTLQNISQSVAATLDCETRHIIATWQLLTPGHYLFGGQAASVQPKQGHPLLVEVLLPDFQPERRLRDLLQGLAARLAEETGLPLESIFIHLQTARSGRVFDAGRIAEWS